ncbi:MAG: YqaE/Pmp3 family membrane protein [bacterium]|jgi:uncharacterized membrane protein YqaE (UPF0057 family)|nr:YqaE/Pmp3 family membrane protein [Chitinophagaceae bacterium]
MKRFALSLFTMLIAASMSMAAVPTKMANLPTGDLKVNDNIDQIFRDNLTAFLDLTPRSYEEMTGQKLTLKETMKLKAAQKMVKNQLKKADGEDTFPKGAYIVLVILGWGFIPLGILSDWKGNDWWVNLLLTFLCWIPGVIHGLSKMKNYYN